MCDMNAAEVADIQAWPDIGTQFQLDSVGCTYVAGQQPVNRIQADYSQYAERLFPQS